MATINVNYDKLCTCHLFPEVRRRLKAFTDKHPDADLYRLDVGDNTQPLTPTVVQHLHDISERLSKPDTYTDHGQYQGEESLREVIASNYRERGVRLGLDEIFVSDGAKSDIGNIQSIFGPGNVVAVQDPTYAPFVDTNVMAGRAEAHNSVTCQYAGIAYMPCHELNNFFPEPPTQKVDLIYLCYPNNPTGATASVEQLAEFVSFAQQLKAIILFDASYSAFITDPALPRSIFEIEGAHRCAIEINSFSNFAGFAGLRLGWAVLPKTLVTEDASAGKLNALWHQRQSIFFSGPSIIAQHCGLAALSANGRKECQAMVEHTMSKARMLRDAVRNHSLVCYGGEHAPYVWVKAPGGMRSIDFFSQLLCEAHVVTLPGTGFGPNGEGFVRLSAFAPEDHVERAVESIRSNPNLRAGIARVA
jgi:LL-diaminopimelate aminotransferase